MTADRPGLTTMGTASPGSCPGATHDEWSAKLEKRSAASRKAWRVRKRMAAAQAAETETVSQEAALSEAA